MSEVTKPIALDESLNTTESTPRNIADVLADELVISDLVTQAQAIVTKLQGIISAVKPDASDIPLAPIAGMVADDVQEGISELKGTLTDLGFGNPQLISNIVTDFEYTVPSYGIITGYWRGDTSSANKTIGITSDKLGVNQYRLLQTRSIAGGYNDINIIVVKNEKLKFATWLNVSDYKLYFVPFTS